MRALVMARCMVDIVCSHLSIRVPGIPPLTTTASRERDDCPQCVVRKVLRRATRKESEAGNNRFCSVPRFFDGIGDCATLMPVSPTTAVTQSVMEKRNMS